MSTPNPFTAPIEEIKRQVREGEATLAEADRLISIMRTAGEDVSEALTVRNRVASRMARWRTALQQHGVPIDEESS